MANLFPLLNSLLTTSNETFFSLIGLCLIIGLLNSKAGRGRLAESLPNIAVSLGILGTFYGIFMGLMDFDPTQIKESVPNLLNGMKTAFATSLAGMSVSIFLNFVYAVRDNKTSNDSDDPIVNLQRIEHAIVSCFKSDEEYSLVSQVKLIRQELIDSRRETKKVFEEFANFFSKMASESLVNELQKVVEKFNAMLNDLVSESFKELSSSMITLNKWQSEYKNIVESNTQKLEQIASKTQHIFDVFSNMVSKLEQADKLLTSIDESLSEISLSGSELDRHANNLSAQNQILEQSIISIAAMGKEASNVVPDLSNKIGQILSDMQKLQVNTANFVEKTTQELEEGYEQLSKTSQDQMLKLEKALETDLNKSLNTLAGSLAALSSKFASDYAPLTEKLRQILVIAEGINVQSQQDRG